MQTRVYADVNVVPMTLDQARQRLARTSGWADTAGFMRVYEAMLRTHGWTDEPTRAAEVDRVRRHFSEVSFAARMQLAQALELVDDENFTTRDIAAKCQPISAAALATALAALTMEGRLEAVGQRPRWRKVKGAQLPQIAGLLGPLGPPLLIAAQRVWHAGERRDLDTVLAHCHDNVIVRPAPQWETYEGHDGFRRLYADLAHQGITWTSTVRAWEQQGNDVLIHAYFHVHSNTGTDDSEGMWLYRFRGEKIALVQML
jgi:ketosteroid isomerase-like protein